MGPAAQLPALLSGLRRLAPFWIPARYKSPKGLQSPRRPRPRGMRFPGRHAREKTRGAKPPPHRWQNALMSLVRPENMGQAKPDSFRSASKLPLPSPSHLPSPHLKQRPAARSRLPVPGHKPAAVGVRPISHGGLPCRPDSGPLARQQPTTRQPQSRPAVIRLPV